MIEEFRQAFDPALFDLVQRVAAAAKSEQRKVYLVGGAVRDALLHLPVVDVDLMLEKNAIEFARSLHNHWLEIAPDFPHPNSPVSFPRYGTVKLIFPQPIAPGVDRLDFATARAEKYPIPGGPPKISDGTIASDLARRDFSVNAMAVLLEAKEFTLVDKHNGREDLKKKVLRVLHPKSFIEDPARLIRAMRFTARFGFTLEAETKKLFKAALKSNALATLTKARLFDELKKALHEKDPKAVFAAMDEAELLKQIHPKLKMVKSAFAPATEWNNMLRGLLGDFTLEQFLKDFEMRPGDIKKIAGRQHK